MDLSPDPSLPYSQVGRYELIRRIGEGGMAEVFLAQRTGIEGFAHLCVVKTILPRFASDTDFVEMFFDEARITVELQHPNIVRVFDLDRDVELVYLAMEFVDGMDVLSMLVDCEELGVTVPFGAALFIISETLKGLHFAHSARDIHGNSLGLVHRDISPGNILLGINGSVKLSDFGVARASISRREEEPGLIVGKLRYFAPELLMGGEASSSSDIFAVGVCLFEMLSMEPLFPPAENAIQHQLFLRSWSPEKMLEAHLNFPDGIDEILLRALAVDPADRYRTALEFMEDVTDLAHESQIRLGDQTMIRFLAELRKAAEERQSVQQPLTTRFRNESRQRRTSTPAGRSGSETTPTSNPSFSASNDGDTVAPSGTHYRSTEADDQDTSDEERTGRFTTKPPAPPTHRRREITDRYATEATAPDAAPPPSPKELPLLADLLSASTSLPPSPPPGSASPLALPDATSVELFTQRGRHGPFSVTMLQATAARSRASGIELVSLDNGPWEPLVRHSVQAGPEFERRIQSFGLLSVPRLLLGLAKRVASFELMLWSQNAATFLAVADMRIVDARRYPAQQGGQAAQEGLAQVLRWSEGSALPIKAGDRDPAPSAVPLPTALVRAMDIAYPPRLFRRLDETHGTFRFHRLPAAVDPTASLPPEEARMFTRLGRGPLAATEIDRDGDLRAALRLVALGMAQALAERQG